jgi:RNA polymerase sigma-70 factor (ECF subfamily)
MNEDSLPVDELLAQALGGDREAMGRLLEDQRAALHRLAEGQLEGRIAVRVDASDVVQQTFLEAYRSFPQFAGRDARELVAWLQGILDHKIASAIRDHTLIQKRSLARERSIDDSGEGGPGMKQELDAGTTSPSQKAIRGEEEAALLEALAELPEDQREAVRLRHLEGWALPDIAHRLGRTTAATAGLIKRGVQTLRRRMDKGG